MKALIFSHFSRALLASILSSQALAEHHAEGLIMDSRVSISSFAPVATEAVEVSMETNGPAITLGQIPAARVFESMTHWASTVTATTTVTTMTTTVMVPRPTADMTFSPTTSVAGRAEPVVEVVVVAFGLSWAVSWL